MAQLPRDMGGAEGKVSDKFTDITWADIKETCWFGLFLFFVMIKVAYIDTEGTFRPERIQAIADRFGVGAYSVSLKPFSARLKSILGH